MFMFLKNYNMAVGNYGYFSEAMSCSNYAPYSIISVWKLRDLSPSLHELFCSEYVFWSRCFRILKKALSTLWGAVN